MAKSLKFYNNSDKNTYSKFNFKKKEIFKQVENIIKFEKKNSKILDVGTANGELIYHLNRKFNDKFIYTGMDIAKNLIKIAKKRQPNSNFVNKDLHDKSFKDKFDIIILIGVSGYYDDLKKLITRALQLLNKNGVIILEGGVNFNDFDVQIKFREFSKKRTSKWENGFNSISHFSLKKFLKQKKVNFKFINWKFNIPIKFHKTENKIRNRTFKDNRNNYWLINGLNLVTHGPINNYLNHNASLLVVRK